MLNLPLVEEDHVFVMRNCHHNDIVALHNRYLKDTPKMTVKRKTLNKYVDEFLDKIKPHFEGKITIGDFIKTKKGKLRQRYLQALHEIKKDGFDLQRDNDIKMFIKNERYSELKPPRAIMGRNTKFNIIYGQYTVPIEHAMMGLDQIVKGENFLGRGLKFRRIMAKRFAEIDYSKFEGSQRAKLLKYVELRILKMLYPNDRDIENIFNAKMVKKGKTCNGVGFSFFGTRGSGDMDTGLFNTILNWIACRMYEDVNNTGGIGNFIVDGDDGVIGIHNLKATKIDTAARMGFDAKIIIRDDYHDVEFCSSKFIEVSNGVYYQVQNLNKLLNNVQYCINSEFSSSLATYFGSLGFMYKQLYKNIPVYYDFAKYLCSAFDGYINTDAVEKFSYVASEAFKAGNTQFEVNHSLCKAELSIAFGWSHTKLDSIISWFGNRKLQFSSEVSRKFVSKTRNKYADIKTTDCDNINIVFNPYSSKFIATSMQLSLS